MRFLLVFVVLLSTFADCKAQGSPVTVAPGLTLPNSAIPWAVEEYQGKMQLVPIHHSTVEINNHNGANFGGALVGSVFYKPKMTTELAGLHARSHLHTSKPVFYLRMDNEDDDTAGDSAKSNTVTWGISLAVLGKDRRVFTRMKMTQFTGNAKRDDGLVESTLEKVEQGWLRLTPVNPLPAGEYAISPIYKIQRTYSSVVFDFSVDPNAPNDKDAVAAKE